jgi:hypothetical protein
MGRPFSSTTTPVTEPVSIALISPPFWVVFSAEIPVCIRSRFRAQCPLIPSQAFRMDSVNDDPDSLPIIFRVVAG